MPENKKEINLEKFLTDHYAIDISGNQVLPPNAEVEKDEWLMYPDGSVQKAYGETHANGGVEVSIPDGTKVLTDSIPVGGENAKTLSKQFDIKVKAKDTFSQVMEKFSKKIGLNKIVEDQENYFKELEKQLDSDIDDSTSMINQEFISGKIKELEGKKNYLNNQLIEIFDTLFDKQEDHKENSDKDYDNADFKFGGVSHNDLKVIADRIGVPVDTAIDLVTGRKRENPKYKVGGLKRYNTGGQHSGGNPNRDKVKSLRASYNSGEIDRDKYVAEMMKINPTYNQNSDSLLNPNLTEISRGVHKLDNEVARTYGIDRDNVQRQRTKDRAYGTIGATGEQALGNTFAEAQRQFPKTYKEVYGDKTPTEVASDFDNQNKDHKNRITKLQKGMNQEMNDMANHIIKKDGFSKEDKEFAERFLENETFLGVDDDVRSLDGKLGEFTSTRRSLGVNVLTPEEKSKAEEKGYTTIGQIMGDPEFYGSLSDTTKERMEPFSDVGSFHLDIYDLPDPGEGTGTPQDEVEYEDIQFSDFEDRRRGSAHTFYPYHIPREQPLEPALAQQVSLRRLDPLRLRYQEDHQALRQGMDRTERSGMTPQQQLAVNSAMVTGQQKADAAGQMEAVKATAQNYMETDRYNAQVSDKEQMINTQLAKTYFDEMSDRVRAKRFSDMKRDSYMHRQALEHYDQNRMNRMYQELFDYNPGYFSTIEYGPRGEWQIQDNTKPFAVGVNPNQTQQSQAQSAAAMRHEEEMRRRREREAVDRQGYSISRQV